MNPNAAPDPSRPPSTDRDPSAPARRVGEGSPVPSMAPGSGLSAADADRGPRDDRSLTDMEAERRRRLRWAAAIGMGVLLLVLVLGFAVIGWENPQRTVERARELQASDPNRALRLLKSSWTIHGDYLPAELLKCQILTSLGRGQEALKRFEEIRDLSACDTNDLLALALTAQKAKVAPLAEKALLGAHRPGPQQVTVLRLLISLMYEKVDDKAVLEYCRELATLVPDDPEPWLVSAGIYHEREQVAAALEAYRQALRRNPPAKEVCRVRYQIAERSLHIGDLAAARKELDLLLAEMPSVAEHQLLNARLLRQEGRGAEAEALVDSILAKDPQRLDALKLRSEIYSDGGQFDRAVADLSQVLRAEPFDREAHHKLGMAYLRLGDTAKGQSHLETARNLTNVTIEILSLEHQLESDPANQQMRRRLAELNEQRGDTDAARRWRSASQTLP